MKPGIEAEPPAERCTEHLSPRKRKPAEEYNREKVASASIVKDSRGADRPPWDPPDPALSGANERKPPARRKRGRVAFRGCVATFIFAETSHCIPRLSLVFGKTSIGSTSVLFARQNGNAPRKLARPQRHRGWFFSRRTRRRSAFVRPRRISRIYLYKSARHSALRVSQTHCREREGRGRRDEKKIRGINGSFLIKRAILIRGKNVACLCARARPASTPVNFISLPARISSSRKLINHRAADSIIERVLGRLVRSARARVLPTSRRQYSW